MQHDDDSRTRTYLHYSSLGEAIESNYLVFSFIKRYKAC